MSEAPDFAEFFAEVHGHGPFPWQEELAARLRRGDPPSSIVAPPGLGKTAALDAWVWALAADVHEKGRQRTIPLRAVFVVDRRGIVDAAHEHAERLARTLDAAGSGPAGWVAEQLRSCGHALSHPLQVVRMRGGVTWESRWLRQPDQPAIVSGTVDQFGSRFLFRGYGATPRMRSINAALVGRDVIAFLDEAHLSTALVETVRDCDRMEVDRSDRIGIRRAVIVPMSATPGVDGGGDAALGVGDVDHAHPVAGPRLRSRKVARLVEVEGSAPNKASKELAETLCEHAAASYQQRRVVLVVCNTIALARTVHALLGTKRFGNIDAHLSIGRARELDKEITRRRWWDRARADRQSRSSEQDEGLVIVSTQTIEVGANLDVDVLVTEAAPLDSLIQRFGRVDRLGQIGQTESVILHHAHRSSPERDLVYGASTEQTWQWLKASADESGRVDFGASGIVEKVAEVRPDVLRELVAPLPEVPSLYPALIDLLSRTDPSNGVDLPVDTYLHGLTSPQPTVTVVWRADLDLDPVRSLRAQAPSSSEGVEVPLEHVRRFLKRRPAGDDLSDLEIQPVSPSEDTKPARDGSGHLEPWVIRDEDGPQRVDPTSLRANDLVILPSEAGGADIFGWTGDASSAPVADIGDLVRRSGKTLRVDERVWTSLGVDVIGNDDLAEGLSRLREIVAAPDDVDDGDLDRAVAMVLSPLRSACDGSPYGEHVAELCDQLLSAQRWSFRESTGATGQVRVTYDDRPLDEGPRTVLSISLHLGRSLDEVIDDDAVAGSSSTAVAPVGLEQHLQSVGARARRYGESLGLAEPVLDALEIAGLAHDLGKVDPRFQTLLRRGDWLAAAAADGRMSESLAKTAPGASGMPVPAQWRWPRGMRHEFVSLALVRQARLPDHVDHDLVEHLVASHHGWSRPLFPPVQDDAPRKVSATFQGQELVAQSDDLLTDWSSVDRFSSLCRRFGWWGLALLETCLRLADMAVSEEGS